LHKEKVISVLGKELSVPSGCGREASATCPDRNSLLSSMSVSYLLGINLVMRLRFDPREPM
jgi:hypothetical protein